MKEQLSTDGLLALELLTAAHDDRCARYPKQYTGEDRSSTPEFKAADLMPAGLPLRDKRRTRAQLGRGLDELVKTNRAFEHRDYYRLATEGCVSEQIALQDEQNDANNLARYLGGEAQHFTSGSTVVLTVEQAKALFARVKH